MACQHKEALLDAMIDLAIHLDNLLQDWRSPKPLHLPSPPHDLMKLGNLRLNSNKLMRQCQEKQCCSWFQPWLTPVEQGPSLIMQKPLVYLPITLMTVLLTFYQAPHCPEVKLSPLKVRTRGNYCEKSIFTASYTTCSGTAMLRHNFH